MLQAKRGLDKSINWGSEATITVSDKIILEMIYKFVS